MGDARADELVTLTRCGHEAFAVQNSDLFPATVNQSSTLQIARHIRDRWALHATHFGEQLLGYVQRVGRASLGATVPVVASDRGRHCMPPIP